MKNCLYVLTVLILLMPQWPIATAQSPELKLVIDAPNACVQGDRLFFTAYLENRSNSPLRVSEAWTLTTADFHQLPSYKRDTLGASLSFRPNHFPIGLKEDSKLLAKSEQVIPSHAKMLSGEVPTSSEFLLKPTKMLVLVRYAGFVFSRSGKPTLVTLSSNPVLVSWRNCGAKKVGKTRPMPGRRAPSRSDTVD
jgi:hypothetical protein